ncbi:hypothetical protein [Sorangium sp. So ce1389]|uniref:hypothetical protein n=1 Tax=Sorangium sp. So ce1389 TaxID=3133336 RepID=UPI003F608F47
MSTPATLSPPLASDTDDLADVLVIGGGPAGSLHQRTDLPDTDPEQAHCLTTGELSSIWVAPRRSPRQRPPSAPHQGDLA